MSPRGYHKYSASDLEYIREHCHDDPADVATKLGATYSTVKVYMQQCRRGVFNHKPHPSKNYYALYLRKTDELYCSGSAQECADELGIKLHSFYVLVHKILNEKTKKWDIFIEPYDEEEGL